MPQLHTLEIEKSKHILLQTQSDTFASASAIYSYLLTLHKKVSIYSEDEIEQRFSFLPWYEKIRRVAPSSADLIIKIEDEPLEYYEFFRANRVKINVKMATALYGALLMKYDNFRAIESHGMLFACLSELVLCGADCKGVEKIVLRSNPLSLFRVKAILYKSMLLCNSATEAKLYISQRDLEESGASMREVECVMRELLTLIHVTKVTLIKSDENMKILKEIQIVK